MKGGVIILSVLIVIISLFSFISAGPYGYNDTMDLKYKVDNGTIIYGYGDGVKYETSLRPKNADEIFGKFYK